MSVPHESIRSHAGAGTALRAPAGTLDASAMIEDLPSIQFGFNELREVMTRFTKRFDTFIADGRRRILEERSHFHLNIAQLQEDEKLKHRDIDILAQKVSSHSQTLAKEASEAEEMQEAIHEITSQRDNSQSVRDSLKVDITTTRKAIMAREQAQRAHNAKLESQARFNSPELEFWTSNLCMDIEGAGQDDHLRFIFTHLDERRWDREAWFELCTASRDYSIRACKPKLGSERIEAALEILNDTRDLGRFLKSMRESFTEALKS